MLTYANQFIDLVQNSKTSFVKNFVTEESYRAPMQAFIDAQTKFAKEVAKISETVYNTTVEQVEKFSVKK